MDAPHFLEILMPSGRLDYRAMQALAEEKSEFLFCHRINRPVLVGGLCNPRSLRIDDPNHLLIYPLVKRIDTDLNKGFIFVGGVSDNDILIPDSTIATQHACLIVRKSGVFLRNLSTTGETYVNNVENPIKEKDIYDGDDVYLGRFHFVFLYPESLYRFIKTGEILPGQAHHDAKIAEIIERLEIFRDLSEYQRHILCGDQANIQTFKSGEVLIKEGDESDAFYILLDGQVKVTKGDSEQALVTFDPGAPFGELAFLTREKRSTSVKCVVDCSVLQIDRRILEQLPPEVREKFKDILLDVLIQRLIEQNAEIVSHADTDRRKKQFWRGMISGDQAHRGTMNYPPEKLIAVINQLDFFSEFTAYQKKRILSFQTHIRVSKKGDLIIKEGMQSAVFYILLTGSLSVVSSLPSPIFLKKLQPGECCGEIAFLTRAKRTANVVCTEDAVLLVIGEQIMTRMGVEIREQLKDAIIRQLVERFIAQNQLIFTLKSQR
jgi:CRP-like cAMP-binding protein